MYMSRFISFLTLGLFFISMSSGLIIVFAYHPSTAFQSVQSIKYLLPYGDFFRQLHYFSSEIFTITLLFHIGFELLKSKIKTTSSSWNYSILGFIAVIILMFSGFVLKGDLSANGAAQVAFNLIKDTPFLKELFPLFHDNDVFYYKFFIWHILFLPLLLGYAIYKHIDTLHVKIEYFSIAIGASIITMTIFSMPADIIKGEKVQSLTSPWFFKGAENLLLRSWSPLSVNIALITPFILLIIYFYSSYKYTIKALLLLWLLLYMYASVMGL